MKKVATGLAPRLFVQHYMPLSQSAYSTSSVSPPQHWISSSWNAHFKTGAAALDLNGSPPPPPTPVGHLWSYFPAWGCESHQSVARPVSLNNPGDIGAVLRKTAIRDEEAISEESQAIKLISVQGLLGPEAPVTRRPGMTEHLLISLNSPGPSSLSLPKWSLLSRQD